MDTPSAAVQAALTQLLASSEQNRAVSLDDIGEALGSAAVSVTDIEQLFTALESAGRTITEPGGLGAEAKLKAVVTAVRALRAEGGGRPTLTTVAQRAGLGIPDVLSALHLLQVMQR